MRHCFLMTFLLIQFAVFSQTGGDKERMIDGLKQSGILRQEGNTLIYKVQKASDTAQARLLYSNLFNDPRYQVKFEVAGQKPVKANTPVTNTQKNDLPAISTIAATQAPVLSATTNCCFCNIKAFQYAGMGSDRTAANPFSEHSWTVPPGVTKIKLEGWSAGGNSWSDVVAGENTRGTDTFYIVRGGGGGAGAYVLSFVSVKAGDVLKIRIPAGGSGSPLIVQFAEAGIGTLNVESGHNAKNSSGTFRYDGAGGRMQMNSGLFAENSFSLRGANGERSWLGDYKNEDNAAPGAAGPLAAPRLWLRDKYDVYGGNGGNAANAVPGGSGLKYLWKVEVAVAAQDGGYPGGGGGAGCSGHPSSYLQEWVHGKGAAGLLLIYY
jgi:hypothetical protein